MILHQGFLLLLLFKSTASYPSQKRDTSSVSISTSSQNVINDENPVNSEPTSFSPHTASPSYYHLKEVIGNAINIHRFHHWRTVSSMIVGSSIPTSPEPEKIKVGEAPPDTTKSGAQTVLDDGSMNSQADPDETSIAKPIKGSDEIVPALSRRGIDFKFPKWNFSGWHGLKGLKAWTRRLGSAPQITQKPHTMQKFQKIQGNQPGQTSRNSMTKNSVNSNNRRIAGSRLNSGVRVGRVKIAGRKGSRASQSN